MRDRFMTGIRSRRSPAAAVVTILAVGGALSGCALLPGGGGQTGRETEPHPEGTTSATQTVEVKRSSFDTVISLPGTVVSDMPFQVTSPVAGRVASVMPLIVPRAPVCQCGAPSPASAGTNTTPALS